MKENHQYLCIDLKSFYASVECVERGLDPMTTDLVVADPERKEGTICLAISPHLKSLGIRNRCRIFEIPKNCSYIIAEPRMKLYIHYAAEIYGIYLKYISKNDIHVYSIDEAFLDLSTYLDLYHKNFLEIGQMIQNDILKTTKITATCGIGTNLYLAKIALDILAKHSKNYIATLNETSYQNQLGNHRPLTDFWMIGPGTACKLADVGILTMNDIRNTNPDYLFKMFGINSAYLIDHAWGKEPTTISEIKQYKTRSHSLSSSQILMRDYSKEEGLIILKEMIDLLCLELVDRNLLTCQIGLYVKYSKDTLPSFSKQMKLQIPTNSIRQLIAYYTPIYQEHIQRHGLVRKIGIAFSDLNDNSFQQMHLFYNEQLSDNDYAISKSVNQIKKKYGKNAIFKGIDLMNAATTLERNCQLGGHKAGEKL